MEDDVKEEIREFEEDLPDYDFDLQKLEEDDGVNNFWDFIMYFRWLINAVLIGIPMTQVIFLGFLWNVWFNIHQNNWWAHGNLYFAMTVLVIIQSINAFWLVFEIPAYLRWTKAFRSLSLMYAIVFTVTYVAFEFKCWEKF